MTAWSRGGARARRADRVRADDGRAARGPRRRCCARARRRGDRLVLSIFVNPTQFGPNEDLARYPRDLPGDLAKAAGAGTDVAFVPEARDVYPPGYQTTVEVRELARGLCGAVPARPLRRRRDGRLQAVQHRPARRRGVRREGLPAARDHPPHGARPGHGDRDRRRADRARAGRAGDVVAQRLPVAGGAGARAVAVARAVRRARRAPPAGERDAAALVAGARAALDVDRVDYVELVDAETLQPITELARPAVLAVAAFVGRTRLIDNVRVGDANAQSALVGQRRRPTSRARYAPRGLSLRAGSERDGSRARGPRPSVLARALLRRRRPMNACRIGVAGRQGVVLGIGRGCRVCRGRQRRVRERHAGADRARAASSCAPAEPEIPMGPLSVARDAQPSPETLMARADGVSVDARLLVITANGTSASLAAITTVLGYLGTPYDVLNASTGPDADGGLPGRRRSRPLPRHPARQRRSRGRLEQRVLGRRMDGAGVVRGALRRAPRRRVRAPDRRVRAAC